MSEFWWRPLTTLGLIALLNGLLWALFGETTALTGVILSLFALLLFHLRHLASLGEWLKKPEPSTVPHGIGVWEPILSDLYHLMRVQSRSQHMLFSTLERFQDAAKAIPSGIVVLDEGDRIEWCNTMAEVHLGLHNDRDRGQQISYLLRDPRFAEYLNAHQYSQPLQLKSTRNREMTLSIQLVPYGDKQKLLISRDITEFERVETMRRDFVANVSHEMRTPLTVVGGFLETLLDMDHLDTTQVRPHLQLMLDQSHRMQRLVEDLLTLSKLESPQNILKEGPVDIPRLVRLLADEARGLSAGRHTIHARVEDGLGILGNDHELRSAFGNLISNAVRYTPSGGTISISWGRHVQEGVFSVSDTGEGIDPQHLPRLTERFYRVDRSRSRETGGTGLGLAIVKHVLSRHQARLSVQSRLGEGSTFSAHFPPARLVALDNEAGRN